MNILITGAKGFLGKNLVCALKNIQNGNDRTHHKLKINEIYEFDKDTPETDLQTFCKNADFVFNLAGVNRPKTESEFMPGNLGFAQKLINNLETVHNTCPVMFASSIQATLFGRYENSEYGKSKLAGENEFFAHGEKTGAKVLVYRFCNLFGKWCKPNYNSVIATFCHNIANDFPITVTDRNIRLSFTYIDDVVKEMINALSGNENRCNYERATLTANKNGKFCFVPEMHSVTLGEVSDLLQKFKSFPQTLVMPQIPNGSFEKKLYSTYLSYLPCQKASFNLNMNTDERGSFTELLKTETCGQFSVNITKPNVTKGNHYHNSKWEFFIVVSGKALISQRKIDTDEVFDFYVSGEKIEAVHMLPGYTHSITNLSDTDELVTLMWANEQFNPSAPDTFFEKVK